MTSNHSPLEKKLWDNWLNSKDDDSTNELIQHYMYLVNFHVERTAIHLPKSVNRDDLKSFGLMGLFDALKKFEIDRDLKFDTYASFRIRGSIIDGLRKEDWLSRSTREKTKRIEQASEQLEQKLQRDPTAKEIAEAVDMTVEEVETLVRDSLFANVLSIDEKPKNGSYEQNEGIGYSIPDEATLLPDENMLNKEMQSNLAEGIKTLNENEQLVISLFYYDELTLTEIGRVLDLTTSRISQIHKTAIFKLRKTLNELN